MTQIIRPLFIIYGLKGGGAERVLLTLLRHLDQKQFQPTLFLLKREGAYRNEVPDRVKVVWGLEGGKVRDAPIRVIRKLAREARNHDVIVGALTFTPTYLASLVGALTGKPAIGWVHTDLGEHATRMPQWHRLAARLVYSRLRHLAFVSQGAMDSAARWLARKPGPGWHTIYNPFDSASYRLASAEIGPADRRLLGALTVVTMGRLVELKGFDVLIRAHARLLREGVEHRLLILGEGEARGDLEALADQLGVRETVLMPGFVSDPLPYLKASTVFALPSRCEGFSMVILESLAVGLPVVSTDCPSGPAEILEGGRYGLLVPVDDEGSLAEALKQVLTDSELRTRFSSAGIARAQEFAPERCAAAWESLLLSVCTENEGRQGD